MTSLKTIVAPISIDHVWYKHFSKHTSKLLKYAPRKKCISWYIFLSHQTCNNALDFSKNISIGRYDWHWSTCTFMIALWYFSIAEMETSYYYFAIGGFYFIYIWIFFFILYNTGFDSPHNIELSMSTIPSIYNNQRYCI